MILNDVIKNAIPTIEKASPLIARMLFSAFPGIGSSWAISLLANAFNITPENIHNLEDTIINDPESHSKIQKIEQDFKKFMSSERKLTMPCRAEINIKLNWDDED